LLKTWIVKRGSREIDARRTEHVVSYTDLRTGLVVRCVAVAYKDFPTVEWTVYCKNTGASPTPILENLQALDTKLERTSEAEFLLHHNKGSPNSPTGYQPLEAVLGPKAGRRSAVRTVPSRPRVSRCAASTRRRGMWSPISTRPARRRSTAGCCWSRGCPSRLRPGPVRYPHLQASGALTAANEVPR
jgi:hypothetical protein